MSVVILFMDLRIVPSKLEKHILEWQPNLTAKQALEITLGQSSTAEIEKDLVRRRSLTEPKGATGGLHLTELWIRVSVSRNIIFAWNIIASSPGWDCIM